MEGVLGLLLSIGADTTEAKAKMEELTAATVAETGEVSNLWRGAMEAITGPTGIALGGITALGGGMLELANKSAEAGNEIFEASEKTGIAAAHLSALKALAKETGGSFDSLTVALSRAGVNLQNALMEPGEITAKVLADIMGGAQNLAHLGLKPMDERLQIVLHRIFELNDVGKRNQALNALMGRGWQQNVEVLELLAREGYGPAIEHAKKFGLYFDEAATRQAHQYTVEMKQLEAEVSGLGLKIGSAVVPKLAEWLAELHTVNYEVQLLEIGLKAQGLALINVGGIFDKQLDKLAQRATEVFTQEHQSLAAYKKEIEEFTTESGGSESTGTGSKDKFASKRQETLNKLAKERIKNGQEFVDWVRQQKIPTGTLEEAQAKQLFSTLSTLSIAEHQQFLSRVNDVKALVNLKVLDTTITKHMTAAMKEYFMVLQAGRQIQEEFAAAAKAEAQAVQDDMLGSVQQLTEGFVALIGGQKAAAVFKAGYEIAEGIADLAAGTWPPNPAAIIAAGLHFEAAAQYALMGGGGGGGRHGSRGVSRTSASDSGGGSPSGVERGGGGPSGGSSSGSGQTIVQIQGNLNTNGQQQLAAWIGIGSSIGAYKLNASGSSGIAASRY